jgi:hypothetical protein
MGPTTPTGPPLPNITGALAGLGGGPLPTLGAMGTGLSTQPRKDLPEGVQVGGQPIGHVDLTGGGPFAPRQQPAMQLLQQAMGFGHWNQPLDPLHPELSPNYGRIPSLEDFVQRNTTGGYTYEYAPGRFSTWTPPATPALQQQYMNLVQAYLQSGEAPTQAASRMLQSGLQGIGQLGYRDAAGNWVPGSQQNAQTALALETARTNYQIGPVAVFNDIIRNLATNNNLTTEALQGVSDHFPGFANYANTLGLAGVGRLTGQPWVPPPGSAPPGGQGGGGGIPGVQGGGGGIGGVPLPNIVPGGAAAGGGAPPMNIQAPGPRTPPLPAGFEGPVGFQAQDVLTPGPLSQRAVGSLPTPVPGTIPGAAGPIPQSRLDELYKKAVPTERDQRGVERPINFANVTDPNLRNQYISNFFQSLPEEYLRTQAGLDQVRRYMDARFLATNMNDWATAGISANPTDRHRLAVTRWNEAANRVIGRPFVGITRGNEYSPWFQRTVVGAGRNLRQLLERAFSEDRPGGEVEVD